MKTKTSPLIYPAVALSAASLAWTTWSLVDLLGTGLIGLTVAAGADVIWGSVILAEARRLRIAGKAWLVPLVGWIALLAVAGLLVWHGINRDSAAMAAAGPLLPLGAKAVWLLALTDMRDPAELTDSEQYQLAEMERRMAFTEARHRIAMREREMAAERQMAEVSTDFDIELMRQDKTRELSRRRPLELTSGEADTGAGQPVVAVSAHSPGQPSRAMSDAPDITREARTDKGVSAAATRTNTVRTPVAGQRTDKPADSTPDTNPPSVAALVRAVLDRGIEDPDTVLAEVRRVRPDAKADSVERTIRRQRNSYL